MPFSKIQVLTLLFSWSELKDIFRKCGKVTYTDAHQRIGEGRGEVCFDSADDLKHALKEMQGFDINGRKIEVFKTHVSTSFIEISIFALAEFDVFLER